VALAAATVAALSVVATVVITAGAASTTTTYYACLKSGTLSSVGTSAPKCTSPATEISWNQTGPTGPAGAAGNTILTGSGAPSSTIGVAGNFYLETSNHTIYGPATHTCSPLPCHTVWGTGTSLVGPKGAQGPAGQGVAYDTQSSGDINDPNGQSERVLTQTLSSGGDFSVVARAIGVQGAASNPATTWTCDLVAANPGGSTVTLDSTSADGNSTFTQLYLQGVVSLAPGGFIGINCDEGQQQSGDSFEDVHITSTLVSSISTVASS